MGGPWSCVCLWRCYQISCCIPFPKLIHVSSYSNYSLFFAAFRYVLADVGVFCRSGADLTTFMNVLSSLRRRSAVERTVCHRCQETCRSANRLHVRMNSWTTRSRSAWPFRFFLLVFIFNQEMVHLRLYESHSSNLLPLYISAFRARGSSTMCKQ